ncbi:hypothetical protein, partial [Rhizobium sp.]|uniref:hypothetical protein n=1 Tax=Rhizobium sp. TaxID=391 RepID=UPI003F7D640F
QPPPVHEDHLSKVASWMLASIPAAIMNHNSAVLGIPKRFREKMIRSKAQEANPKDRTRF